MRKRHRCRPKPRGKLMTCLMSLNKVLKENICFSADKKKTIGRSTHKERSNFYEAVFRELHTGGFIIDNVNKLGTRHIQYLIQVWIEKDLSASSFSNYLSMLRTFCNWIDKDGMMNNIDLSVIPEQKRRRSGKATMDKDWSKTDTFWLLISDVIGSDKVVGCQLLLMYVFGLRAQEAMCLKPYLADHGKLLSVEHGTKGGKHRWVEIEETMQRDILEYAKSLVPKDSKSYSMIPRSYSLVQWRNHFYDILRRHGISKKENRVSHGLRHGYAHRMLKAKTGFEVPILSNISFPKTVEVLDGKLQVSKALGHVRPQITDAYAGG